ncbi:hypothetical protein PHLGIDRAFT_73354 [Phlebiopsis gigantea 11061_1 CR5-6]|uniref:Uncharacterized protein n=1 Tax=Phlebiopsis gigantea (strain 11061_1 CR5-6) TaxID=745531 RepID=A0A0C3S651_PHLG1|nr:hypothetical protein PHLGIDRAFT_73354 [Phlebiopsis gigantea 11061_1 CR5-6]
MHVDQDASAPRNLPPNPRATVEEVFEDVPGRYWHEAYSSAKKAGSVTGTARTTFDTIRDDQVLQGAEVWGPFRNESEWQLAKWLIKNVGQGQADEFLKLAFVQSAGPEYTNQAQLYRNVHSLPGGVDWKCKEVTQEGDLRDAQGRARTETLEVWYRDPVECIKELLGNPMFRQHLAYAPERVYRDQHGTNRHIDEMWTADWWWDMQGRLPTGATVSPVILSSDKTKLSNFRGDKSAWPVYLTIGNLRKETRRSPSMHGSVLLGYLPVGKFDCFSENAKQLARYQAFHDCMRIILDGLIQAGREGVDIPCADRLVRRVWPILAAYVADYPEQCLVAACMENRCPIGQISPDSRGTHEHCPGRNRQEILTLLDSHFHGTLSSTQQDRFKALGLRAIHKPFWRDLPHADIFTCFTPDLLHQLHKGVFKDHLVKWCTALLGEKELDSRFSGGPTLQGLRHFKNGISHVSQWTGHEHKQMERVFLALVAGGVPNEVVLAVRGLLDFIYLASLQAHTTKTLALLRDALDRFHTHKNAFIEYKARSPEHFNIPKYHMLEHYVELILRFGTTDGFNTEWSERLHIDYAKDAYRASNKKDYIAQMTKWLWRQEAVDRFEMYQEWLRRGEYSLVPQSLESTATNNPELDDDGTAIRTDSTTPSSTPQASQASTAASPMRYKVAKTHPKWLYNIPVSAIVHGHRATQFLPALHTYLRLHGSNIVVYPFDGLDLFKQLTVHLPVIPEVSNKPEKLKNVVRATPPIKAEGRRAGEPAQLDFALLHTGERNVNTDGTSLEGLRVAHVRVIFKMREDCGIPVSARGPLAYVEWFTPFNKPDSTTGMFVVARSTRTTGGIQHAYGEIVDAGRIARNCYLSPKYGRIKSTLWTSETVADVCKTFHFNPYIDYHLYCQFVLRHRGCIWPYVK